MHNHSSSLWQLLSWASHVEKATSPFTHSSAGLLQPRVGILDYGANALLVQHPPVPSTSPPCDLEGKGTHMWLCCSSYKVVSLWPSSLVSPSSVPKPADISIWAEWNPRRFPALHKGIALPPSRCRRRGSLAKGSDPVTGVTCFFGGGVEAWSLLLFSILHHS